MKVSCARWLASSTLSARLRPQPPNAVSTKPRTVAPSVTNGADRTVEALTDWLLTVFPYATIHSPRGSLLAAGGVANLVGPLGSGGGAGFLALQSSEVLSSSSTAASRFSDVNLPPRLSSTQLCTDLIVELGGYEARDLTHKILDLVAAATPQVRVQSKVDADAADGLPEVYVHADAAPFRKRYLREANRSASTQRIKMTSALSDCLMACPLLPLDRCTDTDASSPSLVTFDTDWKKDTYNKSNCARVPMRSLDAHRTVFIGFANPQTSLSMVNIAESEDVRRSLRPAFGFSLEVLKQTLKDEIVGAARKAFKWSKVCTERKKRRRHDAEHFLPPIFFISLAAQIFRSIAADTAASGASEVEEEQTVTIEEAIASRIISYLLRSSAFVGRSSSDDELNAKKAIEAKGPIGAPCAMHDDKFGLDLMTNLFLPGESFLKLRAVELWAEVREEPDLPVFVFAKGKR